MAFLVIQCMNIKSSKLISINLPLGLNFWTLLTIIDQILEVVSFLLILSKHLVLCRLTITVQIFQWIVHFNKDTNAFSSNLELRTIIWSEQRTTFQRSNLGKGTIIEKKIKLISTPTFQALSQFSRD